MKTISSTSITSTNGVTLISCIGACRRARPRRPAPGLAGVVTLAAIAGSSSAQSGSHVDLARYDCGELVRKGFELLAEARGIRRELVVEHDGGNCRQETERGGKQGFRNARCDDGQIGVLGR